MYDVPEAVISAFETDRRFVITGHEAPDGDSLGSMLGLSLILRKLGKETYPVLLDKLPHRYRFLLGAGEFITRVEDLPGGPVAVVVLDCGEWRRTRLPEAYWGQTVIHIDHHRTSKPLGPAAWIEPDAASVGEMLVALFDTAGWRFTPAIATCLLTSIYTDTGSLRYASTTPFTLRAAARLLECGGSLEDVSEHAIGERTEAELELIRDALGSLSVWAKGRAAAIVLPWSVMCRADADSEMLVDYPRSLPGVEIAVFVREVAPEVVKISWRSQRQTDVSELARTFGGGGHVRAAGCTIEGELDAIAQRVRSQIEDVLA
jgi:phosphoesterase RecJ-like protein